MKITNQYTPYATNFKAIPLAEYGYLKEKGKKVIVYQLEKSDIGYMK